MVLRLVMPSRRYFDSYLGAIIEFKNTSSVPAHFQNEIDSFPENVINNLAAERAGALPQKTYWAVEGKQYIGTAQIRLFPSARFSNIKSNIYYDVRPSKRQCGYGAQIFALIVQEANRLGLAELIISCDGSNLPSRKIIERAGAKYFRSETVPDRDQPVLMYKLPLNRNHDHSI